MWVILCAALDVICSMCSIAPCWTPNVVSGVNGIKVRALRLAVKLRSVVLLSFVNSLVRKPTVDS